MSAHLTQILSFVLDSLQVVSYKWLSRKFSVSSNEAKRLLQEFVDVHGSEIDVIYVLSGWSKTNPDCYSVQLVPKSKLQEAKTMLKGQVSCHVYSVQPCIPKDSAEIWSAEYLQSEEMFKQPPEVVNCLRDNRFSAVSCLSITRKVAGASSGNLLAATLKVSAPSSTSSKAPSMKPEVPQGDSAVRTLTLGPLNLSKPNVPDIASKETIVDQHASTTTTAGGAATKPGVTAPTKKRAAGPGDGALANLWGRASTKPKINPSEAQRKVAVLGPTPPSGNDRVPAVPHATSHEESSDDDDAANFAHIRRGQARSGGMSKRRVVFEDDSSDAEKEVEECEDITRLASPEVHREELDGASTGMKSRNGLLSGSLCNIVSLDPPHSETADAPTSVKVAGVKGEDASKSTDRGASSTVTSGHKKRKVLKTRIDERGREVTEVVWENEDLPGSLDKNGSLRTDTNVCASDEATKPMNIRSLASGDAKASKPEAPQIPPNKASAKSLGKVASKDSQQGKILSFFKKKS